MVRTLPFFVAGAAALTAASLAAAAPQRPAAIQQSAQTRQLQAATATYEQARPAERAWRGRETRRSCRRSSPAKRHLHERD